MAEQKQSALVKPAHIFSGGPTQDAAKASRFVVHTDWGRMAESEEASE